MHSRNMRMFSITLCKSLQFLFHLSLVHARFVVVSRIETVVSLSTKITVCASVLNKSLVFLLGSSSGSCPILGNMSTAFLSPKSVLAGAL